MYFTHKTKKRRNKIGFVGRWAEVKNLGFCIDLSNHLLKIGSSYKLFLVLDKVDSKTKTPKNVQVLGPFGNKQMKDFYQNMGVILSPSHFETYGRVPQEAVATGTPALISKNMGVSEIFKKYGLSDLIIKFDSPKKVLQKIDLLSNEVIDIRTKNQMRKDLSPSIIYQQLINFVGG